MKSNPFITVIKYTTFIFVTILLILVLYYLLYTSEKVESAIYKPDLILQKHTAALRAVRFHRNGSVVSAGVDSTILIWNESGKVIHTIRQPSGITSIDIAINGNMVTGSYDGVTRLWSTDGRLLRELGQGETIWTVAFSPDGRLVATGGEDKIVRIWDILTGKIIRRFSGHTLNIWSIKFSRNGNYVASAGFDASIKLWSLRNGSLIRSIDGHSQAVVDIAFNNKGDMLASTSDDATIKLWSMPEAKLIRTMEVNEHIQAAAFSPDDRWLLTGGRDKTMLGELFQEILGERLVNEGVSMRLWNVEDGRLLQTFTLHTNDVTDVAFDADGNRIASGSEDKTVRLWKR